MKPRQSIDIGTFQFRRTRNRRSSALASSLKSSILPPVPPLRERTNLLPTAHRTINKPYRSPSNHSSANKRSQHISSSEKRTRREPLHMQIDASLPQPQRALKLIEMALDKQFDANYKHKSSEQCLEFERAKNEILERMAQFVEQCNGPELEEWKPNPEAQEIENKIAQMQALERACQEELDAWERIFGQASEQIEWDTLTEDEEENSEDNESNVQDVFKRSAQVLESYILQARDILSTASKLKGVNLETHYRVQVIAAALNDKVMSQFRGRPSEVLKPPDTLHVISSHDVTSPRL